MMVSRDNVSLMRWHVIAGARKLSRLVSGKGAVTMVPRVLILVAFVWMILVGIGILIGIGDPGIIPGPICIVCGGSKSTSPWPVLIGIITVGLGVAALTVTLMQRRGAS
jgi:hypothetical protein